MKVLVTGHQGRIGEHLLPALIRAGHDVRGIDRKTGGNILDDYFAHNITQSYRPEAIIHLAAISGVQESIDDPFDDAQTNILGTIVALEIARGTGCRIIVASDAVASYDAENPHRLSKKTAMEYTSMYRSLYGVDSIILGLANVYGPGMGGLVGKLVDDHLADGGVTIHGDGTQTRDFIHVDDVIRAFVESLNWQPGYYEIATGISTPVFEVFRALTFKWGFTPAKTFTDELPSEGSNPPMRCDLPWTPIILWDGLDRI